MAKHQILVNKHLQVQTPRNKHWQRIIDLFKLINKDTTIINILFQHCCYHFFGVKFFCISVLLLLIPHLKVEWYNVNIWRDSKHSTALFQLLSRVDNFLGILRKPQINYFSKTSLDGYFMLTSDISVKSVPQQG